MSRHPWLWLIAGPNGAGKSTLAAERFGELPNINADVEAERANRRRGDRHPPAAIQPRIRDMQTGGY